MGGNTPHETIELSFAGLQVPIEAFPPGTINLEHIEGRLGVNFSCDITAENVDQGQRH